MTLGKGQFHKSNLEMPMLRCRDLSEKKLHLNFPVRRESAEVKEGHMWGPWAWPSPIMTMKLPMA